jgi:hypothetical protein
MAFPDESTDIIGRSVQHPNPLFDFLTTFVPRKLKSLFQYCEYLYYNSPQIFAALNKFAIYPVTELTYDTENGSLKKKYKNLLERTIKLRNTMIRTGIDRHVYGNSFVSIYFPFKRFLKCAKCGHTKNIRFMSYRFKMRKNAISWSFKCDKCGHSGPGEVVDKRLRMAKGINIIRWDPKSIEIDYNEITGESVYYYQIPSTIREQIRRGNHHILNTMPLAFIETVARDDLFKFAPGKIYHMKADAPSGIDNRWGFPGLVSTLKQFFHVAVLKKANEAIALEHIVPFRVLHPAQLTANSDPTVTISLSNWVNETKLNLKAWRRDPLHLMFSPVPLSTTQLGGQGRALMVTGEITEAENNIIASMGIPREFIYGGLSAAGGGVTLRMLENQLLNYTTDLIDQAQWISDQCATYMGWQKITLGLEPFKLIDDVQQKMMLLNANQATGGVLFSNTALASIMGYDLEEQRDLRLQETLDEQRFQMDLDQKVQAMRSNLAEQARAQAQYQGPQPYNQQEVLAQAQQLASQLAGMDETTKRSQLRALQNEDAVMYAVVTMVLDQMRQQETTAARAEMQQAGGMA